MTKKRQFSGTRGSRKFFDRKVLHYGYSRTLSMGKVIPKEWQYVRMKVVKTSPESITVEITKLLGGESTAQTTPTHKNNK